MEIFKIRSQLYHLCPFLCPFFFDFVPLFFARYRFGSYGLGARSSACAGSVVEADESKHGVSV